MSEINMYRIDGRVAVVSFDPEIEMFRGEFLDLNGSADFYASSVRELKTEGKKSLAVFLKVCEERGIEPVKKFSGKFQVRLKKTLHASAVTAAAARGVSLNQLIEQAVERELKSA